MKTFLLWGFGVSAVAFAAIQFVPVDRTNPPVEVEVPAPEEVRAVLRRACYDCHSNETVWPWYSRIAPVSWLVSYDVRKGREELNFSEWNRMSARDQANALHESWETAAEGEMPPWFYLPPHPEARLSPGHLEMLRAWSRAERRGQGTEQRGQGVPERGSSEAGRQRESDD